MFLFNHRDILNGYKVLLGFNSSILKNERKKLSTIIIFHSTQSLNFIIYVD